MGKGQLEETKKGRLDTDQVKRETRKAERTRLKELKLATIVRTDLMINILCGTAKCTNSATTLW